MADLLIDTNILLLHVVGLWNKREIGHLNRTAQFSPRDFDLLQLEMGKYLRLLTTAAILTEVSDLIPSAAHPRISETIIKASESLHEKVIPFHIVMMDRAFPRIGFADAGILRAAEIGVTILTDDLQLYHEASHRRIRALNFNHIRQDAC